MIMRLRYHDNCRSCARYLKPGQEGSWLPGWGVWCIHCVKRFGPRPEQADFNKLFKDHWA